MSEYTPRVGDKVRATLGENVLEGTVREANPARTAIFVGSETTWLTAWHHHGWKFEQVVTIPTRVGAVIRSETDGQIYARYSSFSSHPWIPLAAIDELASTPEATVGGFTVLFDGVDE